MYAQVVKGDIEAGIITPEEFDEAERQKTDYGRPEVTKGRFGKLPIIKVGRK